MAARQGGRLRRIKDADTSGTSPGKEVLTKLLAAYAPCVILMDELVAYIRQFDDGKTLSGGTYDANLSFLQALTEALKAVPTAVLLASLPESDKEAGPARHQRPAHAGALFRPGAGAVETRGDRGGLRDRPASSLRRDDRYPGRGNGVSCLC